MKSRGFLLLLAVLLPVLLYRAGRESSLWIDEVHTLVTVATPVPEMLDHLAVDAHPPLYFLMLKGWLGGVQAIAPQAGLFWARLPNVLLWLVLAATAWFGGRRLVGEQPGALLAWAVAASAAAGQMAKEMRGYALVGAALFGCFLLMAAAVHRARRQESGADAALWLAYGVLASAAMWTHHLAALVLGLLGVTWVAGELCARRWRRRSFAIGFVAQAVAAASAVPLVVDIARQVAHVAAQPAWTTPATTWNLLGSFTFWIPFGRVGAPQWPTSFAPMLLGALALAVPVVACASATRRPASSAPDACRQTQRWLAATGLGVAVAYTLLTWGIDRWIGLQLFHAERYTMPVAALYATGLAMAACLAAQALGGSMRLALGLLAPWLACAAIGHAWVIRIENDHGLGKWLPEAVDLLPGPGAPLYAGPEPLLPMFRSSLAAFDVRPLRAIGQHPAEIDEATVLNLSLWSVDPPPEILFWTLLFNDRLAAHRVERMLPTGGRDFRIVQLRQLDRAAIARHAASAFEPDARIPAEAISAASPLLQRRRQGWAILECTEHGEPFRWGRREEVAVQFDRRVASGRYRLHLHGIRPAAPTETAEMTLQLEGTDWQRTLAVPPGPFEFDLGVVLDRRLPPPVLRITHPVWTMEDLGIRRDSRPFSFVLMRAWWMEDDSTR
ncbi:MAG: hypothetical protein KF858_03015 [Candidatus Sumerlaeia bacterium]|nr:hypothetical protein [Candidatus Sumerlaeia bacterium]